MTTRITKPKITNKFLRALRNRSCRHCGKKTLRWEYDGGQVVCWTCNRRPDGWGDRGITGNSSSIVEHGIRGQTVSSTGNSGNIRLTPDQRGKVEVKPEPRVATVQPAKPQQGNRGLVPHTWTGFVTWGAASRPQECIWPECNRSCHKSAYCFLHARTYIQEFGIKPVSWKFMRLWHDGGEVAVKWVKDRAHLSHKNHDPFRVRVLRVQIPSNAPPFANYKTWNQVRVAFTAAMEHKVIDLNDAIKQAIVERDARGVEREAW